MIPRASDPTAWREIPADWRQITIEIDPARIADTIRRIQAGDS
jgi:hypothetical protein